MPPLPRNAHTVGFLFIGAVVVALLYIPQYLKEKAVRKSISQQELVKIRIFVHKPPLLRGNQEILEYGRYRIYLDTVPTIKPGSLLEVVGTPSRKETPRAFDAINLNIQSIQFVEKASALDLFTIRVLGPLLQIRQTIVSRIHVQLPAEHAQLLLGVSMGEEIPRGSFIDQARSLGITHAFVASGSNLTFLSLCIASWSKKRIPLRLHTVLLLIFLWTMVLFLGIQPSIVRAAAMMSVVLLSRFVGRPVSSLYSLGLAAAVMLIVSPFLLYSLSFWLSLTATAGIIFSEYFLGKNEISREHIVFPNLFAGIIGELSSVVHVSLSVLLWTAPVLILTLGKISLVGVIMNAILLWMIPILMLGGILLGISLLFSSIFSRVIALVLYPVLEVFLQMVYLFSRLPIQEIEISAPSIYGIIAWYGVLSFVLYRRFSRRRFIVIEK